MFSEETWEEYALGMQSEHDCAPLEEHLLTCPACQDLLAEVDEYIEVVKAAASIWRVPASLQPPIFAPGAASLKR